MEEGVKREPSGLKKKKKSCQRDQRSSKHSIIIAVEKKCHEEGVKWYKEIMEKRANKVRLGLKRNKKSVTELLKDS